MVKSKNYMSVQHKLTKEERQIVDAQFKRYRVPVEPHLIGLLPRIRIIREIQLWALDMPFGHHRYDEAGMIIKKLGGKDIWDPL